MPRVFISSLFALLLGLSFGCDARTNSGSGTPAGAVSEVELLNVSNDPTRELWRDMNARFIAQYEKQTGTKVTIKQSHGGSASQARSVIDGLEADVVTLGLWSDTDALSKAGLIAADWEQRLPHKALPFASTIVFVVRKGNPLGIKDWPDLVRPEVKVITPNPKTSGNGKLSFLAAWGSVVLRGGSEAEALDLVTRLYKQTPVLDTGARGATMTFAQKQIGDVHLTWESEAYLEIEEAGGKLELVYPPISILAEAPVAVVDKNVDRKGTRAAAEAYLKFAFSPEGQQVFAEHHYRPTDEQLLRQFAASFPPIEMFPIQKLAPGWLEANARFFADGAIFDQIYQPVGP